jgi:hypothetical protein
MRPSAILGSLWFALSFEAGRFKREIERLGE